MTNNNFKNIKTKNGTLIAAVFVIGLIMFTPMASLQNVSAQESSGTISDVIKNLPSLELSKSLEAQAIQIALDDQNVQNQIHGRSVVFMSSDWTGEIYNSTYITAYPVVHFKVGDNSQIGVIVDTTQGHVRKFLETHLDKATYTGPEFAEDKYTGSTTIDGIDIHLSLPTYTLPADMDDHLIFMVNAAEKNAPNDSTRCNSADYQGSYFAQSGLDFNSGGGYTGWADTKNSCNVTTAPGLPYTSGHHYDFQVFVDGSSWVMYGIDNDSTSTPKAYFLHSQTGITNNTFQDNDPGTSVWLENWNTKTDWYTSFSTTSLSPTSTLSSNGGTTWFNWGSSTDGKQDWTCSLGTWGTPDGVISNGLSSGGTATWNLKTMSQSYPYC